MKTFYLAFLLLLIAMGVDSWRRRRRRRSYTKRDTLEESGLAREAFLSDSVVLSSS